MQQQLVQAESRREQLEAENQNLRLRSETAAGEKPGEMEDAQNVFKFFQWFSNFQLPDHCGTNCKHTDIQTFTCTEINRSSSAGRRTRGTFVSLRAKLQMSYYYNSK